MKKLKPYTVILSLEAESCCTYETLWLSHVSAADTDRAIDAAMNEVALRGHHSVLDYIVFDGHLREARDVPA